MCRDLGATKTRRFARARTLVEGAAPFRNGFDYTDLRTRSGDREIELRVTVTRAEESLNSRREMGVLYARAKSMKPRSNELTERRERSHGEKRTSQPVCNAQPEEASRVFAYREVFGRKDRMHHR